MKKYIGSYRDFLLEQDLGSVPAIPGEAPTAPKKEKPFTFIFMDDSERDDLKKKRYPDGSTEISFPSYALTKTEIEDWVKDNIVSTPDNKLTDSLLDLRRSNLVDIVSGSKVNIAKEDVPFIEKLKNSLSADLFGKKQPNIVVIFAKDGVPTTDDIDVTFIKYSK
jgi:hypothetical protein